MDSSSVSVDGTTSVFNDNESMVDPFLVEALQNPRHRLTILRMELDIQRFLSNADQQHFEFQHFPSSYLRLAAHRVAQHYGLQTMVQGGLDGQGSRIMVRKLAESRYPAVRLSEIPAKQLETDKPERIKIVIRPRPCRTNASEAYEAGRTGNLLRSVEERMEEYDRARARIFSSPRSSDLNEKPSQIPTDGRNSCMDKDENETCRNSIADSEKCNGRDISSTRVAIFRDREKDRTDPDYDRSYRRYARNTPNSIPNLVPYNLPKTQPLFAPYDPTFNQMGHMSQTQAPLGFVPPTNQVMSPFATGVNQSSGNNAAYLQWPNASLMYAHTYDQFRHTVYQAPFGQQPLSFDYSQNY